VSAERPFSDISYQQFLGEEKLMGSRCQRCGHLYVPPRPLCPHCGSDEAEWVQMKGKGKLAAFTSIAIGPPFMVKEGYDAKNPYTIGVVELEEGPRIVARIEGVNSSDPEKIKTGTPLMQEYRHQGEGEEKETFLIFRPG